ncbi:ABC transporter ATP-binding protein [Bordetella pertussis]|uniref:Bicarbonate transport ATP-binding protein CmpD n=3 Tax=Bordetella pertussis TaxID=520 RepID=A0A0E7V533_BORPT|nr:MULTISPECIES: ABC transporter ATP-binding protein [Bordetella]ETH40250.1 ABC transporter, ATP-binding protein [Bordetella pertussis H918]ETH43251.1 ABC transporter, ATP-binding protein [Bordetella pertussis H939]ETH72174.1 ABC transporter, ATP-binding protein [Bordetella pertussis STO1-CHLA-0011]ETH83592.1 ABC transporter, ATP-binding protein [Bordetella pertussis STO1-CHOC-0017]ETH89124.1 ABC transporter, ATP-binding protein [Bordetella pertussis STO1-CHOC-0018]ETH90982.1 ABC transporter,
MSHISVTQLSKTYPGVTPVHALDQIDLQVAEGEFVALLGPSGCGKSTLLNLIAGFEAPSGGELRVGGGAVARPGPERGVVFQEAALFPWLNVWENVVFGPKIAGLSRREYAARAEEMLEITGLSAFKRHLPVQLSGGMRQRVGIARVLTLGSRVLLMDEPFGALDAQTRLTMQELLLSVWQTLRTTVVFVTHDIDEAILLADTIYVMSARPGRIATRIEVPIERPRSLDLITGEVFNGLKREILKQMRH